jgi:hypothetical protein
VPKQVSSTAVEIPFDASLKFRQFPPQPSQFESAVRQFTEVPTQEFSAIPAACAIVGIRECVLNDLFRGAKDLCYLAGARSVCEQEHHLELQRCQEICQAEPVEGCLRVGKYD